MVACSEWPTSGESGVQLVPPLDALFVQAPTEVDDAALALARKVDQAFVEPLQLNAPCVDAGEALVQLFDEARGVAAGAGDVVFALHVAVSRRLLDHVRELIA